MAIRVAAEPSFRLDPVADSLPAPRVACARGGFLFRRRASPTHLPTASDVLHVRYASAAPTGATVTVRDIGGAVVARVSDAPATSGGGLAEVVAVDLPGLAPGSYVVTVADERGIVTSRIFTAER